MIDFLNEIDQNLFLALHHLVRSESIDHFAWLVSERWVWVPMYTVLLWWLLRSFGWQRCLVLIPAIALATLCADQICSSYIRPLVERLRPAHPENPIVHMVSVVYDYRGGMFGFPSCHASNTVMLATFIRLLSRSRWLSLWLFAWVALNCFSRIYLGVHYPGDLLFGALIGALCASLWYAVSRYFLRKFFGENALRTDKTNNMDGLIVILSGIVTLAVLAIISYLN